ncbi:unnamed protein product [Gongylonema pulchrum]|uniref:glucuronosyltransferase n=1 Tax=Gongylonema pulchrum TaxID=637853 RepID=A0A183EKB4_9BILA|nr:unnamed protein product [Gongylonema pulchrum]
MIIAEVKELENRLEGLATLMRAALVQNETELRQLIVANQETVELLKAEHFDFGITEIFSPCGYAIFSIIGLNNYATAFTNICSAPAAEFSRTTSSRRISLRIDFCPSLNNLIVIYPFQRYIVDNKPGRSEEIHAAPLRPSGKSMGNLETVDHSDEIKVKFSFKLLANKADIWKMQEAVRKSTFALTDSEELLEFPRLVSHKVVFIGGIAVNTPKPLKKVKKFIMRFRTYVNAINSRAHQNNRCDHAFCAIPSTENDCLLMRFTALHFDLCKNK